MIEAYSRIVRLGEGLSASGRLSEAAMDRAMAALKDGAAGEAAGALAPEAATPPAAKPQ